MADKVRTAKRSRSSPSLLVNSALRAVWERYLLVVVWALMSLGFVLILPETFPTMATVQTVFGSQSVMVVLALSTLGPLIAGELDLSVAGTMGLAAIIVAKLNGAGGVPIGLAILVALAAGILVGVVNALAVVYARVDSIVVTLGMATFLLGVALWISGSETIGGIDPALLDFMNEQPLGVSNGFWVALVLAALVWYVLRHTPVGRHLLFVGQGRDVARLAGLRVDPIRTGSFIVGAFIASIAGVMLVGTLGAFEASTSVSYFLPAFAAAFLGSTVVDPGRFNAWGAVIAIYFLVTGITGLTLLGFSGWIEHVFYGGALVIAATLSAIARRRIV